MPAVSVSIQSASAAVAASNAVALNWRGGRPVIWQVTVSSSVATGDFTVQYTLNDIQQTVYTATAAYPPTGSGTVAPSGVVWAAISSAVGTAGTHYTSSTLFPDGLTGTFTAPPAALRIYSSATSSGVLTLSVVQGDGG